MYDYEKERKRIFTDEGQRVFMGVHKTANKLLDEAGAFMMFSALKGIGGDTWTLMAYIDRMVELGEIKEITDGNTLGQYRVFVRKVNEL